jgi:hypothetical protein
MLFALFPPELVVARRCWQDALVGLMALILIDCGMRVADGRRGARRAEIGFVTAGSVFLLIKESSVLVYGLCFLWVAWHVARRDRAAALRLSGMALFAGALAGAALGWSAGGLTTVWSVWSNIPKANAANSYALEYATGPGYQLIAAYWLMSPLTTAMAFAGVWLTLWRDRGRAALGARGMALFVVAFLAIPMVIPHWLNLRYVSFVFGPLCLLAGVSVARVYRGCKEWLGEEAFAGAAAIGAAALAVGLTGDYQRFERAFVEDGTPDLAVRMVLESVRE